MSQVIDSLDEARATAARQAWRAAYTMYSEIDAGELTSSDLESYAEAAWWSGKLDEAIALRERAHTAFNATGDKPGAARMALALAWDYEGRGAFAVSHGWLATARRLLETLPESPEHSRLLLTDAMMAMYAEGDLERAESLFESALRARATCRRPGRADTGSLREGARAHQGGADRRGAGSSRRGNCFRKLRRCEISCHWSRLLPHDQLVP